MLRDAVLSDNGQYRYRLTRRWAEGEQVTFVMLNPSTADAHKDDPTLRRCIGFARSWGYAALSVVNLYAFRATNPEDLWRTSDPVGDDNDIYLRAAGQSGDLLVAAWGANAKPERAAEVIALPGFERIHYLRLTRSGQPSHPLYLPKNLTPIPFSRDFAKYERLRHDLTLSRLTLGQPHQEDMVALLAKRGVEADSLPTIDLRPPAVN